MTPTHARVPIEISIILLLEFGASLLLGKKAWHGPRDREWRVERRTITNDLELSDGVMDGKTFQKKHYY